MRGRPGDQVELFDGTGWEFTATVERVGRQAAWLRVDARRQVSRELGFPLVLAVAVPRGDRQEWLVEKSVELGVTRLVPWQTQRSVARPGQGALQRWRRTVIEASKQCGRNQMMEIAPPCEVSDFLPTAADHLSLLAHVNHPDLPTDSWTRSLAPRRAATVQLGVGPEGGFSPREAEQAAAAGWHLVGLGPRLLRCETAALLLVARVISAIDHP
jgi:16S rRNA (uracil1498-N3)-methyltransferase